MKNVLLSRLPHAAAFAGLLLTLASPAQAAPGPFTLGAATPKTMTPATLAAAQKTDTRGQVSANKKALTFRQKTIRLVVVTGPDDDMLSYRIAGLRTPTLIVPRGATLRVLFVNTDDDMAHNIRFGGLQKSYPNAMDAYMHKSVGASPLPHKTETAFTGEELTLCAPATPGAYAYLCTVRGHAQGGMIGTVIVR